MNPLDTNNDDLQNSPFYRFDSFFGGYRYATYRLICPKCGKVEKWSYRPYYCMPNDYCCGYRKVKIDEP